MRMNSLIQFCILIAITQFRISAVDGSPNNRLRQRHTGNEGASSSQQAPIKTDPLESWNQLADSLFTGLYDMNVDGVIHTLDSMIETEKRNEFKEAFEEEKKIAYSQHPNEINTMLKRYIFMHFLAIGIELITEHDETLTQVFRRVLKPHHGICHVEYFKTIKGLLGLTVAETTIHQVLKKFRDDREKFCWNRQMRSLENAFSNSNIDLQSIIGWLEDDKITICNRLYYRGEEESMQQEATFLVGKLVAYLHELMALYMLERNQVVKTLDGILTQCTTVFEKNKQVIASFFEFSTILEANNKDSDSLLMISRLRVCQVITHTRRFRGNVEGQL